MSKIIAIAIPKGGVAKTTTSINLAFALASKNKKVLLVDLDPAGTCSQALGFTNETIRADIFDVFLFSKGMNDAIYNTESDFVDFIPLKNLLVSDEQRLKVLARNKYILRNVLAAQSYKYDYILFDCPPYLDGTTTPALIAANSILIPVRADEFSLSAIDKLKDYIKWIRKDSNNKLVIEGILLTFYEPRTKASYISKKNLLLKYPNHLLKTKIPKNSQIVDAFFNYKSLICYNSKAKASVAYCNLAEEIIERQNNPNLYSLVTEEENTELQI